MRGETGIGHFVGASPLVLTTQDSESQWQMGRVGRLRGKRHMQKITTFLMFGGQAEEAIRFYTSLFDNSHILSMNLYGADEPGAEGTVMHATFSLDGQLFMGIDSNIEHAFTFTPAISLHVSCETEAEIDRLFQALSQDGQVLMPLDSYPFSEKYGWLSDRFGVSWQLSLA
jgi:predicted 3-demethylubiquinone-9 3-methyltransferase (glyoxalase superfamily)